MVGKSVKADLSYDRTYKQANKQTNSNFKVDTLFLIFFLNTERLTKLSKHELELIIVKPHSFRLRVHVSVNFSNN